MTEPVWLRRVNGVKLLASVLTAALAAYLAIANASYWAWVANSAFRGIRAPTDVALGIRSVVLAVAPIAAGVGVFLFSRRRARAAYRPIACGAGAALAVVVPAIAYSVLLTFPF